jgi:hypothetical protein
LVQVALVHQALLVAVVEIQHLVHLQLQLVVAVALIAALVPMVDVAEETQVACHI